jgi:L-fuconolactonase
MAIVDTHCHAALGWYEPVETMLFEMDRAGVDQAVLIQMRGQRNNDYVLECARRFPDRLAAVVWVDVGRPDVAEVLGQLAADGAHGVRLFPTDPLPAWLAAAEHHLPVSCLGTGAQFATDAFAEVIQAVPDIPVVIEHLGSALERADAVAMQTRRTVFALARFPNVYIKVPGLGEFCVRAMPVVEPFPFETPIPPYLEWAYDAFGPRRMMWGSDFPPVTNREGYANALRFPMAEFAARADSDRAEIFGGTAQRVFRLPA